VRVSLTPGGAAVLRRPETRRLTIEALTGEVETRVAVNLGS
jgi:hypothetical protein